MQKVSYMGDGSTKEFYFNFPYFEDDNIIVTKNNINATGFCILGTSAGTDADIPYTGGKVVFDIAPTTLDNITIARSLPLTRVVDYQPLVKLNPTTLNQDMNYMMEIMKDFNDELETFSIRYSELAESESTAVFLSRITTINQNVNEKSSIAETSATNAALSATAAETAATSANSLWNQFNGIRTNCITEIPQDINLTLSNGTLTLKAGSRVYVPNGAGVFNKVTVANDINFTFTTNTQGLVLLLDTTGTSIIASGGPLTVSGATDPLAGQTYHTWYDTTNNIINRYTSDGTIPWKTTSFPIATITVSGGAISSIDQVFNGFGYIGSNLFVLPGVKYLIPQYRNSDGSLKNLETTTSNVLTRTFSGTNTVYITLSDTQDITWWGIDVAYYDGIKNVVVGQGLEDFHKALLGTFTISSGQITSLNPKTVFHALDYNDSDYITNCAMPSKRYINLTLPASGSSITTPANGYLTISKDATAIGQHINMISSSNGMNCNSIAPGETTLCLYMPVSKGDVVTINYDATGTTNMFRFIYANGAK